MSKEIEVDQFESIQVKGSLFKGSKTGRLSFFMGGKENATISRMEIGFYSQEQVDDLIDKLLDVKLLLKK